MQLNLLNINWKDFYEILCKAAIVEASVKTNFIKIYLIF